MSGALRKNQTSLRVPMASRRASTARPIGLSNVRTSVESPVAAGPHGQQLVGLVGADQQRRAELVQQGDEAVGLRVVKRDRLRRRLTFGNCASRSRLLDESRGGARRTCA